VLLAGGQRAEAEALLEQVPANLANHAAISGAKAALDLYTRHRHARRSDHAGGAYRG